MSEPSKSASPHRFLSGFFFGTASIAGFLPPLLGKLFKNPNIPITSEKLAPWALFATGFAALYLRDRDIRQIKALNDEIARIQKAASEKPLEPTELKRLQEIEKKYNALLPQCKAIIKASFSLFELAGSDPLTDEDLNKDFENLLNGLPENLDDFKGYLTQLKSDADQFLPPEQWRSDVKRLLADLPEKMALSSTQEPISLLAGQEATRLVDAIVAIREIFTLLGDEPTQREEIEGNVHGWVQLLPESLAAFKTFVQELQSKVHKEFQASAERFKNNPRPLTPTKTPNQTPSKSRNSETNRIPMKPLNFDVSNTPQQQTNTSQ